MMLWVFFIFFLRYADATLSRAPPRHENEVQQLLKCLNKPFLKSFQMDDGDVVDCVPIRKQPAFDHPLLKNHTIQDLSATTASENNYKVVMNNDNSSTALVGLWRLNETCPQGTVPIRRVRKEDIQRANSLKPFGAPISDLPGYEEDTALYANNLNVYYGGYGELNVWTPNVERWDEESASIISLTIGSAKIEAGWHVSPSLYRDYRTRLYALWHDGGKGCYNTLCPGFVQSDPKIFVGTTIWPISEYKKQEKNIGLAIFKGRRGWVLRFGIVGRPGEKMRDLGYWPYRLFDNKKHPLASTISWGGKISNDKINGLHTTTEMGSGHRPDTTTDLRARVCYTRFIMVYYNNDGVSVPPAEGELQVQNTAGEADNYKLVKKYDSSFGRHIFFGGQKPRG